MDRKDLEQFANGEGAKPSRDACQGAGEHRAKAYWRYVERGAETATQAGARIGERGMTLIEIMVVIVIIGVLGSALAYGVFGMLGDAKIDAARAQVQTVGGVIEAYQARNGDYPSSLQALTEGKRAKLKQGNLKDPWKQDLQFSVQGDDGFSLCSNGEDKRAGSPDDICYGQADNNKQ